MLTTFVATDKKNVTVEECHPRDNYCSIVKVEEFDDFGSHMNFI